MPISDLHASHIRRVEVTFSVSALNLDPDRVTLATGLIPTESAKRGDERRNVVGNLLSPQSEGCWAYSSTPLVSSRDINDHFAAVLGAVLPHAATLLEFAKGGETFFNILWESTYLYAGTGPLIDACHLQGIGTLRAAMGFDIYQINEP